MTEVEPGGGQFGRELRTAFQNESARSAVIKTAALSVLELTEIRSPNQRLETKPLPRQDAYMVSLYLSPVRFVSIGEVDAECPAVNVGPWEAVFQDLNRPMRLNFEHPFHSINLHIPRHALDEAAEACQSEEIAGLGSQAGQGVYDETVINLMKVLMSALRSGEGREDGLFNHVGAALVAYLAQAYGGMTPHSRRRRGGLAPWQQKRIQELIAAGTEGGLTVGDLADECRISHRHFQRAFRQTMGTAPHLYIQNARVEQAKLLLSQTNACLGDVGLACGFADQSHFTRVFAQLVGMTPGAWRKAKYSVNSGS
ncbi:AraC family transcriptional regulator [Rhizobium sp. 2MFCol3.1]|uniref:AraC family transcriptional regulator n=1 Tax=Rhizobium sp. 2MFCol3.1 TaxID=1246459 RepID=UPI00036B9ED9|nr:AraC family transcriptional regulator [Rhizobium sp. 2MFCol3.1]